MRTLAIIAALALFFIGVRYASFALKGWTDARVAPSDRDPSPPKPTPQANPPTAVPAAVAPPETPPKDQPEPPATAPTETPSDPEPASIPPTPFALAVSVTSPLWSAEYDPKYPIPFTSSSTRNYLTVTIRVENPTDQPQITPVVTLVDGEGTTFTGFGPCRDQADYDPQRPLLPGAVMQGVYMFNATEARESLVVKVDGGPSVRVASD